MNSLENAESYDLFIYTKSDENELLNKVRNIHENAKICKEKYDACGYC